MKPIPTGRLKYRICVKQMGEVPGKVDELGQDATEEQTIGFFWANIESRTGSLLKGRTADTVLSETTHIVKLRYTELITEECWIEYGGFHFEIDYISPDFERKWMEVFVRGTRLKHE